MDETPEELRQREPGADAAQIAAVRQRAAALVEDLRRSKIETAKWVAEALAGTEAKVLAAAIAADAATTVALDCAIQQVDRLIAEEKQALPPTRPETIH
jgi:hypothetical protein